MKKHNLFKVIGITILVAFLLTWILPSTYYNYGLIEDARQRAGIFDLLSYATVTISYFGNICLYILAIGGFYGVVHKIDAYRTLLDRIVKGFKGKENIFMIIIMVLFAVITSMTGLSLGILFLFPFVISIILLMGYNKITAVMTTVGGVLVGLIGSTYSYANTSQLSQVLSVKPATEIIAKLIILVLGLAILIFNVLRYAKANRDTKNISKDESYIPVAVKGKKKVKVWPLVLVVDLLILIMLLAFIPWADTFKINFFADITKSFLEIKIGKFAVFGSIFGKVNAFGAWTLTEALIAIVITSGILGLIYRVKFNDYLDNFISGAKRALKPAALVALIYVVLVLTTYHPFLLTILKPLLKMTSGLNVFTMSLVAFISSIFNVEMTYSVSAVMPYAMELITKADVYPVIAVIWQAMYGLAMLVAPTSVILFVTLAFMHVRYTEWLKAIWKLFVELLIVLLIVFTILIMI